MDFGDQGWNLQINRDVLTELRLLRTKPITGQARAALVLVDLTDVPIRNVLATKLGAIVPLSTLVDDRFVEGKIWPLCLRLSTGNEHAGDRKNRHTVTPTSRFHECLLSHLECLILPSPAAFLVDGVFVRKQAKMTQNRDRKPSRRDCALRAEPSRRLTAHFPWPR